MTRKVVVVEFCTSLKKSAIGLPQLIVLATLAALPPYICSSCALLNHSLLELSVGPFSGARCTGSGTALQPGSL